MRRGQGFGAMVGRGALDDLRSRGKRVVPSCWFVRDFIELHDEYADLIAA